MLKLRGSPVFHLRADNEFNNPKVAALCAKYGVQAEFTDANSPQQNSVVESRNRLVWRIVRIGLAETGASMCLWAECFNDAVQAINKLPTSANGFVSPYERFYGVKPEISQRRVWGCLAYFLDPTAGHAAPHALKGMYMGEGINQYGHRILNLETQKICVSRNVIFFENIFPLRQLSEQHLASLERFGAPSAAEVEAMRQLEGSQPSMSIGCQHKLSATLLSVLIQTGTTMPWWTVSRMKW